MSQPGNEGGKPNQQDWQAAKGGADKAPQNPGMGQCPKSRPEIDVSWRDHDFKKVRKGKDAVQDLVIYSTGGKDLTSIHVSIQGDQFKIDNPGALPPLWRRVQALR